jgi:hypothetical protein
MPVADVSHEVCHNFLAGRCRYGANCHRIHEGEILQESKVTTTRDGGDDHGPGYLYDAGVPMADAAAQACSMCLRWRQRGKKVNAAILRQVEAVWALQIVEALDPSRQWLSVLVLLSILESWRDALRAEMAAARVPSQHWAVRIADIERSLHAVRSGFDGAALRSGSDDAPTTTPPPPSTPPPPPSLPPPPPSTTTAKTNTAATATAAGDPLAPPPTMAAPPLPPGGPCPAADPCLPDPDPERFPNAWWRANAARYLPFIEREMAAVQSRELFLTPLQHVSSRYDKSRLVAGGLWLEFGVATGKTISVIAEALPALQEGGVAPAGGVVFGFDSFQGLPEDWRPGFTEGHFEREGALAPLFDEALEARIVLVPGWFEDTLPAFLDAHPEPVSLLHLDCDLYSSAVYVLRALIARGRIVEGTVIIFDELFGYSGFEHGEFRALFEVCEMCGLEYEWIGVRGKTMTQVTSASMVVTSAPAGGDGGAAWAKGRSD